MFDALGLVLGAYDIGQQLGGWIFGGKKQPNAPSQAGEGVWCWDSPAAASWRAAKYRTVPEGSLVWVDPSTGGFKVTPPRAVPVLPDGSLITFHPKTGVRGVFNPAQVARAIAPAPKPCPAPGVDCPSCPTCPDAPECPTCPPPAAASSGTDIPVVQCQGSTQRCVPVCPIGTVGPQECGLGVSPPPPPAAKGAAALPGILGDAARALEGLQPEGPTPGEAMRRREAAIDAFLCDAMPWLCALPGITRPPVPEFRTEGTMEGPQAPQPPPPPQPPQQPLPQVDRQQAPNDDTRERRERRQRASARRTCPAPIIHVECPSMSMLKTDARGGKTRTSRRPKRRSTRRAAAPTATRKARAPKRPASGRASSTKRQGSPAQQAARQRFAERARAGEFRRRKK